MRLNFSQRSVSLNTWGRVSVVEPAAIRANDLILSEDEVICYHVLNTLIYNRFMVDWFVRGLGYLKYN